MPHLLIDSPHLSRYREIAWILTRHGLGWLVLDLGLGDLLPFHKGRLGHLRRETPYSQAEHFRMALEDLGVTAIKLGQMLSTRPDLLSPDYIAEFAQLQDAVPPVPYPEIAAMVEQELGAPPEALYATFDPVPRAAASIGQAHAATLADGTPVIVKVQRPGIESAVDRDLAVLSDLARLAAARLGRDRNYDPQALVEEFGHTLLGELDYMREGRSADRFRESFAKEPALHVPRVYWDLTTRRVLTMEEIRGVKISDLAALDGAGFDRRLVAANAIHILLTEVFVHGFFHADPHPGNFFVQPGGVIGLIDFGMVGRLDEALRGHLLRLTLAVVQRDTDRAVDELLEIGVAAGRVDRQGLKRDLDHFVDRYYDQPLADLAAGRIFDDIASVARRHHLQLPTDLMLLVKVIAMSEGLGARLDPEFSLLPFMEPFVRRYWLATLTPTRALRQLAEGLADLSELGLGLPPRIRRLLRQLERGEVTVTARPEGLEDLVVELNRMTNRLATSVLTAALIIGLGLLMLIYHPPGWNDWGGWFFGLSFFLAVLLGLRLMWSMWRS